MKKKKKIFSSEDDELEFMKIKYEEYKSTAKVAGEIGRSTSYVWNKLKKANVIKDGIRVKWLKKAIRLRSNNVSLTEIGERCGISKQRVKQVLLQYDIEQLLSDINKYIESESDKKISVKICLMLTKALNNKKRSITSSMFEFSQNLFENKHKFTRKGIVNLPNLFKLEGFDNKVIYNIKKISDPYKKLLKEKPEFANQ